MNRLINIIGIIVLCGILLKLSYVFVYLFGELDNDSLISKVTGVTFAFASVYFVVNVRNARLKITMVLLDVVTILYFYLHDKMQVDIEYAAIIIASYSGLIIYYLGRIIGDRLSIDSESASNRLQEMENRQRTDVELRELEAEMIRCRRRIRQSRTDETRRMHEQALAELEEKYQQLKYE